MASDPLPGNPLPGHGPCFVCGVENSLGLGVQFHFDPQTGRVRAHFAPGEAQQGAPGFAHGGSLAAPLDEAMGAAAWCAGHRAMAVHLEFDYRKAVPLGTPLLLSGWVTETNGRKIHTKGEARFPDGAVAVESRGLFVLADKIFENSEFRWDEQAKDRE
ncbi:MAG: PaaI family thioesterase [Planctomycetes bacterium]|nr:PaaI family thioesterase [Planctomycetota bacterium]